MGFLFGPSVFQRFLQRNSLDQMVRSHQLCAEGFMLGMGERLVTVWSAPNYCYRFDNKASVCQIEPGKPIKVLGFEAAPESTQFKSEVKPQPLNFDAFLT